MVAPIAGSAPFDSRLSALLGAARAARSMCWERFV
jgi:hypothetical protein